MICISVTPESRQLAKVDILNAARQSDMVELCLDHLHKEPDVREMLEGAKKPILVSCRRRQDGGHFEGSEDERFGLLRQAILANPAYIELDLDAARKIPRFGNVQRVISITSLTQALPDIEEVFDEAVAANADVIKFTWPTPTLEAAWPLLASVSQRRAIPIVGLGLGRCGLTFSLLGRKYGSPWIYAALEKGMEAFPGQPTVGELDGLYRWRDINSKTRFIGIAGFCELELAVAKVFNAAFDEFQMNTRCLPFDVKSVDQLPRMLEILKVPAVIVTPPAMDALCALAQPSDESANTSPGADLLVRQNETWQAHTMLWKSAVRHLESTLGAASPESRPLERRNVMVIGGGGLAKSLVSGIQKRGGLMSICAGNEEAARKMAAAAEARFIPIGKVYDTLTDVLVITEANLDHGSRHTPLSQSILRPGITVLDMTGLPGDTALAEEAQARGCKVVDSPGIFIDYVQTMFKSLTGRDLPPSAFAAGLLSD